MHYNYNHYLNLNWTGLIWASYDGGGGGGEGLSTYYYKNNSTTSVFRHNKFIDAESEKGIKTVQKC